eukprot:Sspe_Gene.3620::Locus_1207_Transcript_3_3_Confidence_0.714_Length_1331::g.3620::m.3620
MCMATKAYRRPSRSASFAEIGGPVLVHRVDEIRELGHVEVRVLVQVTATNSNDDPARTSPRSPSPPRSACTAPTARATARASSSPPSSPTRPACCAAAPRSGAPRPPRRVRHPLQLVRVGPGPPRAARNCSCSRSKKNAPIDPSSGNPRAPASRARSRTRAPACPATSYGISPNRCRQLEVLHHVVRISSMVHVARLLPRVHHHEVRQRHPQELCQLPGHRRRPPSRAPAPRSGPAPRSTGSSPAAPRSARTPSPEQRRAAAAGFPQFIESFTCPSVSSTRRPRRPHPEHRLPPPWSPTHDHVNEQYNTHPPPHTPPIHRSHSTCSELYILHYSAERR